MTNRDVTLPGRNARRYVLVVALTLWQCQVGTPSSYPVSTYVLVRNITGATQHEQDWLLPCACSSVVGQKSRADDANGVYTAIPDVVHSLCSTAGEARSHDLARVDIRIRALAGIRRHPIDGRLHGLRVRRATAVWRTFSDGQEAVASHLLEKGLVGPALVTAGTVTPDQHRHLSAACAVGGVVDGVVGEGTVRLVGARSIGSSTTASLSRC